METYKHTVACWSTDWPDTWCWQNPAERTLGNRWRSQTIQTRHHWSVKCNHSQQPLVLHSNWLLIKCLKLLHHWYMCVLVNVHGHEILLCVVENKLNKLKCFDILSTWHWHCFKVSCFMRTLEVTHSKITMCKLVKGYILTFTLGNCTSSLLNQPFSSIHAFHS